ncbi:hypothetical protein niasHT_013067 [Heterodera trifolii]|uniref:Uncharacterized protein n=1 Tax=Heterodera trifolii TaxID=157864 RepID=A0ABD2L7E5_9BILA
MTFLRGTATSSDSYKIQFTVYARSTSVVPFELVNDQTQQKLTLIRTSENGWWMGYPMDNDCQIGETAAVQSECKRRSDLSESAIAKKVQSAVRVQETCGSAVLSESAIAKKVQSAVRVQETCGSAVLSESAIAKKVLSAVRVQETCGSAVLSESAIAKKVQSAVRLQETCGSAVLSESAIAKKVQSAGHQSARDVRQCGTELKCHCKKSAISSQSARDVRECGTELKCRCKKSASGSAVLSESAIAKKVQSADCKRRAGVRYGVKVPLQKKCNQQVIRVQETCGSAGLSESAIAKKVQAGVRVQETCGSAGLSESAIAKKVQAGVRLQEMQPMGPVEGLKQSMTKETESAMRSLKKIILKIGAEKRSPETGAPAKEYEAGQFYNELLNRTSTGNFPPNIGTRFVIPQDSNAPNYANEVMKVCSRIVTFCCQANTTEIDDVFQLGQFQINAAAAIFISAIAFDSVLRRVFQIKANAVDAISNKKDPDNVNKMLTKVFKSVSAFCTQTTVDDLQWLQKFLSDYAFYFCYQYASLLFGRSPRSSNSQWPHWVNKVLLSSIEVVSHCGTCANTTADELRSMRIFLCCHALKRLNETQYIIYDYHQF